MTVIANRYGREVVGDHREDQRAQAVRPGDDLRWCEHLALRIAGVRPVLGDPLIADLPELVRAGLPLPAEEEEREEQDECRAANDE